MNEQLQQAIALRTAKKTDEALVLFQELYAAHPDDALVNYHFAWLYDSMGDEQAAVPHYEKAIASGLADEDLRGAMLGLGSTYRCLGQYDKAIAMLQRGIDHFAPAYEFKTFLAMTLYNKGEHAEAMRHLLEVAAQTSTDEHVQGYQRAILFYADKLDQVW